MNPETHLLASWIIGAKTTDNSRDCHLVALAGILPDADGLGLILDAINRALGSGKSFFYQHYHHYLLHGLLGGMVIALLVTCFAERKWHGNLVAWRKGPQELNLTDTTDRGGPPI